MWDKKLQIADSLKQNRRYARYQSKRKKQLKKLETQKEHGNWYMRVVGEKPVFFDSLTTLATAKEMTKLLRTKGFFQGKVTFKTEVTQPQRKKVVYEVTEGTPTFINKPQYEGY